MKNGKKEIKKQNNKIECSPSQGVYSIFLGLQFVSKNKYYTRKNVIKIAEMAVNKAQAELHKKYPGVKLILEHKLTKLGKPVNAQIVRMVKNASVAIFEVSEKNPNVYFEMGLAFGRKITEPIILLNTRAAKKNNIVGSDVKDLLRLQYRDKKLLLKIDEMAEHITKQIAKRICKYRFDVRRMWTGGSPKRKITIICPTLTQKYIPRHARRISPEFVKFAKYGDADALVEILKLINMLFPNIVLPYFCSREVPDINCEDDLIIIGGPDFNNIAKGVLKESKCPIQYTITKNKDAFIHNPSKTTFPLKQKNQEIQDYGLFVRFPNPFNPSKTCIIIGGLGTHGVLGTVKAFEDTPIGRKNVKKIINAVSENPFFAIIIPVKISSGRILYPEVDLKTLCRYPWDPKR